MLSCWSSGLKCDIAQHLPWGLIQCTVFWSYFLHNMEKMKEHFGLNIPRLLALLVLPLAPVSPEGLMFSDVPHWDNSPDYLGTSCPWASCSLCLSSPCLSMSVQINECAKDLNSWKAVRRRIQNYFVLNPEVIDWVNVDTESIRLVQSELLLIFRMSTEQLFSHACQKAERCSALAKSWCLVHLMVLPETHLGIILCFLSLQIWVLLWGSYRFVAPAGTLSNLQQPMFYFIQIPSMKQCGNLLFLIKNLKMKTKTKPKKPTLELSLPWFSWFLIASGGWCYLHLKTRQQIFLTEFNLWPRYIRFKLALLPSWQSHLPLLSHAPASFLNEFTCKISMELFFLHNLKLLKNKKYIG